MQNDNTIFREQIPLWLSAPFADDDEICSYVMFSRFRLIRNLSGYRFPLAADRDVLREVRLRLGERLLEFPELSVGHSMSIEGEDWLQRTLLFQECGLPLSRQPVYPERVVFWDREMAIIAAINQEDHLNLIHMSHLLPTKDEWYRIFYFEQVLDEYLQFARDDRFGYLTSSPALSGLGFELTIALHVPGLILASQLPAIIRGLRELGFNAWTPPRENVDAGANILLISNSRKLHCSEEATIELMHLWAQRLITLERRARNFLLAHEYYSILDYVSRSLGMLRQAYDLGDIECAEYFSAMDLGWSCKLLKHWEPGEARRFRLELRPAHLHLNEAEAIERDGEGVVRARKVRAYLAEQRLQ